MLRYEKRDALMARAVAEARLATAGGDVPVGAVITNSAGEVIAAGHNHREADNDPTGHAELAVIREASRVTGSWRLSDCVLVVTLEPCVMCAGAILAARIPTVIFGAWDSKAGAAGSVYDVLRDRRLNHQVEVITGVREVECAALLTEFFRAERG